MPIDGLMIALPKKGPDLPPRPGFKASGGRPSSPDPSAAPSGMDDQGEQDPVALLKHICKMCDKYLQSIGESYQDEGGGGGDANTGPPASSHDQLPPGGAS